MKNTYEALSRNSIEEIEELEAAGTLAAMFQGMADLLLKAAQGK